MYEIIRGDTVDELAKNVNEFIDLEAELGYKWRCAGGPFKETSTPGYGSTVITDGCYGYHNIVYCQSPRRGAV